MNRTLQYKFTVFDRSVILNSERLPDLEDLAQMPLGFQSGIPISNDLTIIPAKNQFPKYARLALVGTRN